MHGAMAKNRPARHSLLLLTILLSGMAFVSTGPPPVSGQVAVAALVAAVLPSSRSALVGSPVTAFVTVVNAGSVTAHGVGVFLKTPIAATLTFQTTDAATNLATGIPNAPVDLGPGKSQTFVIALTPSGPFSPTVVEFDFSSGPEHVDAILGVNTLLLSASATRTVDVVALAATVSHDGILETSISGAMATAFATLPARQA